MPPSGLTLIPSKGRRPSPARRSQNRAALLFVAPFFLTFVAMLIVPLLYSGWLSLWRSQLVGGTVFVGVTNYVRALTDPLFHEGLLRMALFLIVQVPIMLGLALFLALALDSGRVRGFKAARLLIFIPYAVPGVVATLMWGYLYGNDYGLIAQSVRAVGLEPVDLLQSDTILGAIMNVVTWEFVGYNMIIMYAALRAVPSDLYEAARIDGANQFQIAWRIKIPAIRPAILLTTIFSVIGTFQLFNEPALMRVLNPSAIGSAFTPNLYAYNLAFVNREVSYAAALAFLLGGVIAVISYVVQTAVARRTEL